MTFPTEDYKIGDLVKYEFSSENDFTESFGPGLGIVLKTEYENNNVVVPITYVFWFEKSKKEWITSHSLVKVNK